MCENFNRCVLEIERPAMTEEGCQRQGSAPKLVLHVRKIKMFIL
jgi:hypothetical protein